MKKSLTAFALREIKDIHGLSKRYNGPGKGRHEEVLLALMADHVKEITRRLRKKDGHYVLETGDLLILCLELIREGRASSDAVLSRCYKRYRKKLTGLIDAARERKPVSAGGGR